MYMTLAKEILVVWLQKASIRASIATLARTTDKTARNSAPIKGQKIPQVTCLGLELDESAVVAS